MTVEFKVGDKVRIKEGLYRAGYVGTVMHVEAAGISISFQTDSSYWYSKSEVEKVDDVIWKKGTKVRVTVEATVDSDTKTFLTLVNESGAWIGGVELEEGCVTVEEVKPTTAEILEKLPIGWRFKTANYTYIKVNDDAFVTPESGFESLIVFHAKDFDAIEVL